MKPIRVQRKRSKGWTMPENTVYVGRPSMFGNPFEVKRFGLNAALAMYRNAVQGYWIPGAVPVGTSSDVAYACHLKVREQFRRGGCTGDRLASVRIMLRGKNLSCWCPLDQRCHADVLLELANREHTGAT